jgi:hypothetical protein
MTADEIGFGNPPGRYEAQAAFDLVAIGDSFTWPCAVAPADAWPIRLGAELNRTTANLGVGGTGPYEYLQIFKRFGLPKTPRAVILNVYEGNDLQNLADHVAYRSGTAHGDESDGDAGKTSVLWPQLRLELPRGFLSVSPRQRPQKPPQRPRGLSLRRRRRAVQRRPGRPRRNRRGAQAVAGEVDYALFDEPLREFKLLANERGFQQILAYMPAAATAYAPATFRDPAVGEVLARFSADQREHLRRLAQELDMRFVDLTPVLQAVAAQEPATPTTSCISRQHPPDSARPRRSGPRLGRGAADVFPAGT